MPDIPQREEIAVDVEMLAKLLGVPADTVSLRSWMDKYAARAITDALGGDEKRTANIAISNAKAWIQYTYDKGKHAGIREERERWKNKITKIFDL